MNNVRTVSDTKRAFYNTHTRPINSIYRRVVEELMVEMHLLSVNADFHYDPIYALGVVNAFERFMQGYRPENDKVSIFNALCQSIGSDPQTYRQDFERLQSEASGLSLDNLMGQLKQSENSEAGSLTGQFRAISQNPKFKYSRLFAIGLYTLLERVDFDLVKDEKRRNEAIKQVCDALNLPEEKVQKDLELYRSNLEKIAQAQIVMEDMLKADRKKKEERAKAKDAVAAPPSNSQEPT
ncbi:photosystem II biogenesis protein Psp29 [Oculatella sp. FACHB-28]|uniref:photosystem II biogenesis protein Psp29 n=1 Tax=Cyanophyceae TaxID=3028117 RepID=UPI0016894733|nr:photosystem II biogenesis protein Psp29 [Oculatella sp. FACHB-28]MBD2067397.1 photosystem II biogenesis protein Psp29 [Leptolyngbya sp. FACHB-671]